MRRATAVALATLVLLAGCTAADGTAPSGTEPAATRPPSEEPPVPSTPHAGQDPARTRFAGRIRPIPTAMEREVRGTTWDPGCPVPIRDLRLLRFNYWGFDGQVERGPMVVHEDVATDVLWVFERLFRARFPLKRVALARRWRPHGPVDTTRSVTAAFNCRPALSPDGTPTGTWSEHAYGLAVDVNPLQNPYVAPDGSVLRPAAEAYLDRSQDLPGMIHAGDVVVRAFAAIGWEWGGSWSGKKDYMHFSLHGR